MTLIPIVALSLAAIGDHLGRKFHELNPAGILKAFVFMIITAGVFANLWDVRDILHKTNYRGQDEYWVAIGEKLGHDTSVAALTQDYGYRLEYWGWVMPSSYWPYVGDIAFRVNAGIIQPDFELRFADLTKGRQYFLVSDLTELNNQPQLREKLSQYKVYDQGDGYIIYDLLNPLGYQ